MIGCIDLSVYQWRNRLLIAAAPSPDDPSMQAFRARWQHRESEIADRDLLVFHLYEDRPGRVGKTTIAPQVAETLRRELDIPAGTFTLLLIGKDGASKLRAAEPVRPEEIFGRIDAMPMRRQEIRQREQPPG